MSWRIILVANPCKLSVKDKQFLYEPVEGEKVSVPIEDISVVILETKYATLTSALLAALAESGAVLFSCAENHIPSGAFFPFHKHSRYSEIASLQKDWTEPFKKRVWQEIVKRKIANQAHALKLMASASHEKLELLSTRVQSGDSECHEALAARIYWESLFDDFTREKEDWRNSCLNYGYAILRGAVARSIVSAGLLPCFGLNHANGLNSFNLADDLIEPFRPFVDVKAYNMFKTSECREKIDLTPKDKQELVKVLTELCFIAGEKTSIINASDTLAFSLAGATRSKDYKEIKLPKFIIDEN